MNYTKAIAQVVVTVLSALAAANFGNAVINPSEWVNIVLIGLGALNVFAAPNVPGAKYTKAILSAAVAAATVLTSAITGGITQVELIQIIIAAAGALGVWAFPNKNQKW